MKANATAFMLTKLGVAKSHGQPHTSNDNLHLKLIADHQGDLFERLMWRGNDKPFLKKMFGLLPCETVSVVGKLKIDEFPWNKRVKVSQVAV